MKKPTPRQSKSLVCWDNPWKSTNSQRYETMDGPSKVLMQRLPIIMLFPWGSTNCLGSEIARLSWKREKNTKLYCFLKNVFLKLLQNSFFYYFLNNYFLKKLTFFRFSSYNLFFSSKFIYSKSIIWIFFYFLIFTFIFNFF